jgi:hypothetical protein
MIKRADVWASLDNGVYNGFGELLINSPATEVATDLGTFDSQFEGQYSALLPHIRAWQKQKRSK